MTVPDGYEIRTIAPAELREWWELRMQALHDHPDAFGADYDRSLQRGPAQFQPSTVDGSADRLFGAFTAEGTLVAQAAVSVGNGKRSHIATIYSVHTDRQWRGRGLSKALIRFAITHCRALPEIRQVHITVNAGNTVAIAVYTGAGFIPWGREPRALRTETGFHDEIHLALMVDDA